MSARAERWVSLDCFGTLVDWHGGFSRLLRPHAGDATERLLGAYHQAERELEAERPARRYRDVLTLGLRRAAQAAGVALAPGAERSLVDGWRSLEVFGDVEDALGALRAQGLRLAVLTNCDVDLFAVTGRAFRQAFDLVLTAQEVGDYKPAPAHFRIFAARTGAAPGRWVHAACSHYHDVRPAAALGVPCVWIDRDRTGDDPALAASRIEDARRLPQAVAEILG